MKNITLLIICIWALFCRCTYHPDARLARVNQLADNHDTTAMMLLDSIERAELTDADQHYYDLLYLKSRIKNEIFITDTLIESVTAYYARHQSTGLYPEALYYGGCIYRTMGDIPTSLSYLQSALDLVPEGEQYLRLHCLILGKIADMYGRLLLYDEALDYYNQALAYDSLLESNAWLMFDYTGLGGLQLNCEHYYEARESFHKGVLAAAKVSQQDSINMAIKEAGALCDTEQADSVLKVMQELHGRTEGMDRNLTEAFMAYAFYRTGQWDSVYVYAQKLIYDRLYDNRLTGYSLLLKPEMRALIPPDTLADYSSRCYKEVDGYLMKHDSQQALIQNSMYNYNKHVRERDAALAKEHRMVGLLMGAMLLVLALIVVLLYLKNHTKQQIIKLRQALDVLDRTPEDTSALTAEALRRQITERTQADGPRYVVPDSIARTDAYLRLTSYLDQGKGLPDKDALWAALMAAVEAASPGFRSRLNLLTEGNLTDADLQIVLLVKCGVSPAGMATLLNKSKGAISSRRRSLSLKIFGENMGNAVIDHMIEQL
jgi:tetratricopeptide (TPR) repeat protein